MLENVSGGGIAKSAITFTTRSAGAVLGGCMGAAIGAVLYAGEKPKRKVIIKPYDETNHVTVNDHKGTVTVAHIKKFKVVESYEEKTGNLITYAGNGVCLGGLFGFSAGNELGGYICEKLGIK